MAGMIDPNDPRYVPLAQSLLRWLRFLERYGIKGITAQDFEDGVLGRKKVERFVNFVTTVRGFDALTVEYFSWENGKTYQQEIARGDSSDPGAVSVWSWNGDTVSAAFKASWEGGSFHPETFHACKMMGEALRYGGPPPP